MTAAPGLTEKPFDSYPAFYRDRRPDAIRDIRSAGRVGATLLVQEQGAGDWSDVATPDLVVTKLTSAPVRATIDAGAGQFSDVVPRGTFVVTPPHVATTTLVDGTHHLLALAVPYGAFVALAGEDSGLPEDGDFGALHACFNRDRDVSNLLDRLWAEAYSGSPHGSLFADGALLQLAATLLRLRDRAGEPRAPRGLAPWQVKRATTFVADNLANDFSLVDMAAAAKLSPFHFARAFKRETGMSPHRYLMERRVQRARDLLAGSEMDLAEIALACGFANQSHFTTAFKRHAGVTPGAFRQELRL